MDWVPSGELFLPQISITELKSLYKKEKNSKAKTRLLCAILRKKEYSISDIVKHTEVPRMTVSDHLRRLHRKGIGSLYDKKQAGRPKRITSEQVIELEKIMENSPKDQNLPFSIWSTKLVRDFIENKYRVSYKIRQTRNILRKIGFSPQKPRPKHMKSSTQAQEDFKKTSGKPSGHMPKMDMRSSFWMKASSH